MRIKAKRMILIIVVCIVVYLVAGAMGPFIKYKDVSSQTAEEFRADSLDVYKRQGVISDTQGL